MVLKKKARNKYNLKWLRLGMSYHKFSNLGKILQGDLTGKLMDKITSKNFEPRECNCHNSAKINEICACNGKCRRSVVIYKTQSKKTGCFCIGNTQQKLKARITQHFTKTRNLLRVGETADPFAKHFASICQAKRRISQARM